MFQRSEYGHINGGAGTAALVHTPLSRVPTLPFPARAADWRSRVKFWADDVQLVPDLGHHLFSVQWFRGLATCMALCFAAISLRPGFAPLPAFSEAAPDSAIYDEVRSQMLTPLALGADSGRHMGPTDKVVPLTSTPERPTLEVSAALREGDSFGHVLSRAGVSESDIAVVAALVGGDVAPDRILPGTRIAITLGRRSDRNQPRPLDAISLRARLDLRIEIRRDKGVLDITRIPIRVDNSPVRIEGAVSNSIYRAARAAGAPPGAIQNYLRVLGQQVALDSVSTGDRFDLIYANRHAETGEDEPGQLLYAGLRTQGGRKIDLLKWTKDGDSQWFEASGVGRSSSALSAPVSGRLSSGFGMRFHPILGYSRMHAGVDFAAPTGAPIYAVTGGVIEYAGWHGGHGNFVRIRHAGGLGTGYGHMSRIATDVGARVRAGQVIGYVGSTGLSTGPHLHFEVYRNGQTVNPASVKFSQPALLAGAELKAFRRRLAELKALNPGRHAARAADEPGRLTTGRLASAR